MKKKEWIEDYPPYDYEYDMKSSKAIVKDPLFEYSITESPDGAVSVSNDISVLFNLQRLENKITPEQLREYINKYTPNNSPYVDEKLSDDMLLDTVKSRHIQSLSELRSWAQYVSEQLNDFINDNVEKESPNDKESTNETGNRENDGSGSSASSSADA